LTQPRGHGTAVVASPFDPTQPLGDAIPSGTPARVVSSAET
jgi:hypothetical protein